MHINKQFFLATLYNTIFWTFAAAAFVLSTTLFYATTTNLLSKPELSQALTTRQATDLIVLEPIIIQAQTRFLLALGTFLLCFFFGFLFYALMIKSILSKRTHTTLLQLAGKLMLFFIPFMLSFVIGNKLLPQITLFLTLLTLLFVTPILARSFFTNTSLTQSSRHLFQTLPFFILILFLLILGNTIFFFFFPPAILVITTFVTFILWNTAFHQHYLTRPCTHK